MWWYSLTTPSPKPWPHCSLNLFNHTPQQFIYSILITGLQYLSTCSPRTAYVIFVEFIQTFTASIKLNIFILFQALHSNSTSTPSAVATSRRTVPAWLTASAANQPTSPFLPKEPEQVSIILRTAPFCPQICTPVFISCCFRRTVAGRRRPQQSGNQLPR